MADMTSAIRVLLVDDDPLVLAGLRMILGGATHIHVVAEVKDGADVAAAVREHTPHVVLMDIRMPRVDGLTSTEQVRARPDAPEVVVLTTFDSDAHVLRALRAGASGFLLKDSPPADILRAVERVAADQPMLSPTVTRQLIAHVTDEGDGRRRRAAQTIEQLGERERAVVVALTQGRSNAEIAADLYLSVATVKAHISRLLTKLDLNNRTQLALLGHDAGLE